MSPSYVYHVKRYMNLLRHNNGVPLQPWTCRLQEEKLCEHLLHHESSHSVPKQQRLTKDRDLWC